MAAYAALVTLINLMEDMQNHPRLSPSLDNKQIKSLSKKVHFLLNFIETYNSHGGSKEAQDLERRIVSAAQEAEDVIESRIVNQILGDDDGETSPSFLLKKIKDARKKVVEKIQYKSRLEKVLEQMDCIKKKMMKIEMKDGMRDEPVLATSSRPRQTSMVGFEEELIQLMDVLTSQKSTRQIISIVGMGGAGKTTLTTNAFKNSLIEQHFDIRAWATVSQEYSARDILSQLLSHLGHSRDENDSELGEQLYKMLLGKRYLIVLDDMWSINAWDEIRFSLPDNGTRSRVVITTRLSNLASHVGSSSFVLKTLDKDESWKLFCEKAFGEDDCPPELLEIGKEIVEQCQGLPLSIVVIGGYLSKSSSSKEQWQHIANDIYTILCSGKDDQCLTILSLSYSHLPVYLKPCFLYMGTFPEDEEISVGEVIRLWVAEGFLKPNRVQTLEEIGESYLKDLVDRNLILVHSWGDNGNILRFKIHDLVRELCLKEAEKEKFLCVLKLLDNETPRSINRDQRRLVIHGGTLDEEFCKSSHFDALKSAPLVRSLICDAHAHSLPLEFRLLKIQAEVSEFPNACDVYYLKGRFSQQLNLRYLHHNIYFRGSHLLFPYVNLHSSISLVWNLQTLILGGNFQQMMAPPEIWEMPQLRHLFGNLIRLPDPPRSNRQRHGLVLQNLQTLLKVENFMLSDEVCKRIPNMKNVHIMYGVSFTASGLACCSHNLGRLRKLESLTCAFAEERYFGPGLTFPGSLRELCLIRCVLGWEDLTIVGSLPFLVVLKLRFSIKGEEWNPVEGEFICLKYLEIWCCDDLIKWNAESFHFPVLESLAFRRLSKLEEIPMGVGEIPTLGYIQLEECSVASTISAMRILVEQESLGNLKCGCGNKRITRASGK
ncbi:putative late blight resistance protein homolog R1B-16 [Salvia miltiorrhiza]|uniref:putative late blight resistance protein homolog R1B-16 n=1 Tax=Salvia miltiorrhiza TaxID=226208 RepID=UPI0025AC0ABF|nr:putative late blight resistance protein homolog R1B-16 [Salvia miltiorrhiza]